ncbi:MAG: outer membrane protein transport protein [Verrucomicrobiota bacterium]
MRSFKLLLFALLTVSHNCLAVGFGFEYQSVRASARGNVSTAGFSDASMLHYNPAALIHATAPELALNTFFPNGTVSYENNGSNFDTEEGWLTSGSLFYSHPFEWQNRKYALGAGIRIPYGQKITWPDQVPFSTNGISAEMVHIEYLIGGAIEIGKGLSLGANLSFATSELSSRTALSPSPFLVTQGFEGDDTAWGYQIALHHQITNSFSWGLTYRSGYDLTYEGSSTISPAVAPISPPLPATFPTTSDLSFPDHWTIGCEWQATPKLSLGLQAQRITWSVVENFNVSALGTTQVSPVDWQNVWLLSAGATYQLLPSLDLHLGYLYSDSIINEPYPTPLNTDFDQHFLSLGFTWRNGSWTTDLSVVRVMQAKKEVTNSNYGFSGNHNSNGWLVNAGISKVF